MDKFKGCPWCGGGAYVKILTSVSSSTAVGYEFTIACRGCGATLPGKYHIGFKITETGAISVSPDEREQAVNDWNRRVNNE